MVGSCISPARIKTSEAIFRNALHRGPLNLGSKELAGRRISSPANTPEDRLVGRDRSPAAAGGFSAAV